MSKTLIGIIVFIIYIIITICVILWIGLTVTTNSEALMAGALFILTALGIFLYNPIKNEIDSFVNGLYTDEQIERILIFGRSESGKSTFITNAFTIADNSNQNSTEFLSIEKHDIKIRTKTKLGKNQDIIVDVLVGDYKGEDPAQLILEELPDFLGYKRDPLINSIVFIVDLIPAKSDDNDKQQYVDDKTLLKWLIDVGIMDTINGRINKHKSYLGDGILNVIFKRVGSKNLRKVAFVINKIDLIEELIQHNNITISPSSNAQEFAKAQFTEIIKNLEKACSPSQLNIELKIFCISANSADSVKPVILYLLEEYYKRS
jgi:hypothetical protein